jgi:hypothetical protein
LDRWRSERRPCKEGKNLKPITEDEELLNICEKKTLKLKKKRGLPLGDKTDPRKRDLILNYPSSSLALIA